MSKRTIKIKASIGRGGFSLSTTNDLPTGSNQIIEDAKQICGFLLGVIPSGTFDEVGMFLERYKGKYPISFGDDFLEYFAKRASDLLVEENDDNI